MKSSIYLVTALLLGPVIFSSQSSAMDEDDIGDKIETGFPGFSAIYETYEMDEDDFNNIVDRIEIESSKKYEIDEHDIEERVEAVRQQLETQAYLNDCLDYPYSTLYEAIDEAAEQVKKGIPTKCKLNKNKIDNYKKINNKANKAKHEWGKKYSNDKFKNNKDFDYNKKNNLSENELVELIKRQKHLDKGDLLEKSRTNARNRLIEENRQRYEEMKQQEENKKSNFDHDFEDYEIPIYGSNKDRFVYNFSCDDDYQINDLKEEKAYQRYKYRPKNQRTNR